MDADSVELRAPFYGRDSPKFTAHGRVEVVDLADEPDLRPGLRTNGVGLPGFLLGWFRLSSGDRALLAVTDRSQVLYLPHADGVSWQVSRTPLGCGRTARGASLMRVFVTGAAGDIGSRLCPVGRDGNRIHAMDQVRQDSEGLRGDMLDSAVGASSKGTTHSSISRRCRAMRRRKRPFAPTCWVRGACSVRRVGRGSGESC